MKLVGRLLVGMLAATVAANVRGSDLGEDGDWQTWYTAGVSMKSGAWKLKTEGEIRAGGDARQIYYSHVEVALCRTITSWLDLSMNYRQIEEKKSEEWEKESRPHLNATLKWKIGNWSFSDRNRIEFRDMDESEDTWRYRNKLTVYPPFRLFGENVKPYVADEIYEDMHGSNLNRNRVYAGAECKFAEWLKGDICYFMQSSYKSAEWTELNIVNVKLEVTF
jgi:hypothetical protein